MWAVRPRVCALPLQEKEKPHPCKMYVVCRFKRVKPIQSKSTPSWISSGSRSCFLLVLTSQGVVYNYCQTTKRKGDDSELLRLKVKLADLQSQLDKINTKNQASKFHFFQSNTSKLAPEEKSWP